VRQFHANFDVPVRVASRERPRRREPFVQFVPLAWLAAAARVAGTKFGLHVAVLLHYRKGLTRTATVFVPSKLLAQFGVDRHGFYRALRSLESAALVSVERRKGRKPVITIVSTSHSEFEVQHVADE
jgi:DNA-binding MarR family transcriptional regulator